MPGIIACPATSGLPSTGAGGHSKAALAGEKMAAKILPELKNTLAILNEKHHAAGMPRSVAAPVVKSGQPQNQRRNNHRPHSKKIIM